MGKNVLICLNYNDYKNTKRLVDSVSAMAVIDAVVIVDNCSTDDSYNQLLSTEFNSKVYLIKTDRNLGYAAGNNAGIRYIDKILDIDKLIIANPDVYIEEEVIAKCISNFQIDDKIAISAPNMRYSYKDSAEPLVKLPEHCIRGLLKRFVIFRPLVKSVEKKSACYTHSLSYAECFQGSFFVADYKVFKSIGFFDEGTFLYFEEIIASYKLKQEGYTILIDGSTEYVHDHGVAVFSVYNKYSIFRLNLKSEKYYWFKVRKIRAFTKILFNIVSSVLVLERFLISKLIGKKRLKVKNEE